MQEAATQIVPMQQFLNTLKQGSMILEPWNFFLDRLESETASKAIEKINELMIAIEELGTGIEILSSFVAGLVTGIAEVKTRFGELTQGLDPVRDKLSEFAGKFGEWIIDPLAMFDEVAKTVFDSIYAHMKERRAAYQTQNKVIKEAIEKEIELKDIREQNVGAMTKLTMLERENLTTTYERKGTRGTRGGY